MLFTRANVTKKAADHGLGYLSPAEALAWCKASAQAEAAHKNGDLIHNNTLKSVEKDDLPDTETMEDLATDDCIQKPIRPREQAITHPGLRFFQREPEGSMISCPSDTPHSSRATDFDARIGKRPINTQWLQGSQISKRPRWEGPTIPSPTPLPVMLEERGRRRQSRSSTGGDAHICRLTHLRASYPQAPKDRHMREWIERAGSQSRDLPCDQAQSSSTPHAGSYDIRSSSGRDSVPRQQKINADELQDGYDNIVPAASLPHRAGPEPSPSHLDIAVAVDSPEQESLIVKTPQDQPSLGLRPNSHVSRFGSEFHTLPKLPRTRNIECGSSTPERMEELSFVTDVAPSSRNVEKFQFRKKRKIRPSESGQDSLKVGDEWRQPEDHPLTSVSFTPNLRDTTLNPLMTSSNDRMPDSPQESPKPPTLVWTDHQQACLDEAGQEEMENNQKTSSQNRIIFNSDSSIKTFQIQACRESATEMDELATGANTAEYEALQENSLDSGGQHDTTQEYLVGSGSETEDEVDSLVVEEIQVENKSGFDPQSQQFGEELDDNDSEVIYEEVAVSLDASDYENGKTSCRHSHVSETETRQAETADAGLPLEAGIRNALKATESMLLEQRCKESSLESELASTPSAESECCRQRSGPQSPWVFEDMLPLHRSDSNRGARDDALEASQSTESPSAEGEFFSNQIESAGESGWQQTELLKTFEDVVIAPVNDMVTPRSSVQLEQLHDEVEAESFTDRQQLFDDDATNNPWISSLRKPSLGRFKKRVSFDILPSDDVQDGISPDSTFAKQAHRSPSPHHIRVGNPEEDLLNNATMHAEKFNKHVIAARQLRRLSPPDSGALLTSSPAFSAQAEAFIQADRETSTEQRGKAAARRSPSRHLTPRTGAFDNIMRDTRLEEHLSLHQVGPSQEVGVTNTAMDDFDMEGALDDIGNFLEDWSVVSELGKGTGLESANYNANDKGARRGSLFWIA